MSFAERQQRLQRYFIETGLQGWEDADHPPNEDKLIFDVTKILFVLKKIKEKIDNNPDISRWKDAIQDLRRSQQRIEERKYIRWIVRVYQDYLYRIYDIKYIHRVLVDTIQRLGPFLSVPEGTEQRHLTIQTILMSLEIMEEILQPVRDFVDLREANSLIRTNFRIFMREPWNYQYYDDLGVNRMVHNTSVNQRDLEQVFIEENLRGWGTQGEVAGQLFQHLDRVHQGVMTIFDTLHGNQQFWNWWQQMDRIRVETDSLQTEDQLTYIRDIFWEFQQPFHMIWDYWRIFTKVLEKCAPYLSQPIHEYDILLLRRIVKALRIVGMYRIIVQPFIMITKGLPFIITGDLPANAQAQLPHEGPPGAGPPGVGPSGAGPSGARPSSGSPSRSGHSVPSLQDLILKSFMNRGYHII